MHSPFELTQELSEKRIQNVNNEVNKSVNMSNMVTSVLDIYEQSNIKVPADIIEKTAEKYREAYRLIAGRNL